MGVLIGTDEAGYGPNLGPLVITASVWEVPGDPRNFDFFAALSGVVSEQAAKGDQRLHVADSKAVTRRERESAHSRGLYSRWPD